VEPIETSPSGRRNVGDVGRGVSNVSVSTSSLAFAHFIRS